MEELAVKQLPNRVIITLNGAGETRKIEYQVHISAVDVHISGLANRVFFPDRR
jgi:hypothetical protein